ncbi:putative ribosome biogenesis protein RLP24 isoform 2-T2 [Glossina fuscipes fuscipes]
MPVSQTTTLYVARAVKRFLSFAVGNTIKHLNARRIPAKCVRLKAVVRQCKELAIGPRFEFEKARNAPIKYSREMWKKALDTIKRVNEIKERRQDHFVMD